jgi:hypothetical protein
MPRDKDFKRVIRARMKKTGEAYTAARAQLTRKSKPVDLAALAGVSDASVNAKTGHAWEHWVKILDQNGAARMAHRDIVALLSSHHGVGSWWAQTVTVGYERIKGVRTRGQKRDGTFGAGKSRTFNVPVATLFDAWKDTGVRRRWLDETVKIRTATRPKSMRLGWHDGTIVAVGFVAKSASKSSVAIEHSNLADQATAERLKQYWGERFDVLRDLLVDQARCSKPGLDAAG